MNFCFITTNIFVLHAANMLPFILAGNIFYSTTRSTTKMTTKYWERKPREFKTFVAKKFAEFGIVPDLITSAPNEICNVTFPSGAVVRIGEKLSAAEIKEEPMVEWKANESALYSIFMQNMDDHEVETSHSWAVVNSPGSNYFEGYDFSEYTEQAPDMKRDSYRIVFLIYKQSDYIDPNCFEFDYSPDRTPVFDIQYFADRHELGEPVAGNFFIVDDLKPFKCVKKA